MEKPKKLTNAANTFRNTAEREQIIRSLKNEGVDPSAYYQEAKMNSPYVNTHRDIDYCFKAMTLHSHAFYEIICCRSSCGAEYLVGTRRYALQKGDIILVRPGVRHCAILPEDMVIPYERDIIWLSTAFQEKFQELLGLPPVNYEKDLPTYQIRTVNSPWEHLCDMIHHGVLESEKKDEYWQSSVLGNTLQVVTQIHRAYISRTVSSVQAEKPDQLDRIMDYIEDHYTEKITLADIAKAFYITERTISTLFRKRLGITFYQFLTQRRLIAAKDLIQKGVSLETVAESTGFGDYSAFYRTFKSELGISPREFKKLHPLQHTPRQQNL